MRTVFQVIYSLNLPILANYAREASNRLALGLRFVTLAPWRLMKDTGTGDIVVPSYAAYLHIPEPDFIARMTLPQTKENVAEAVVAFVGQWPAARQLMEAYRSSHSVNRLVYFSSWPIIAATPDRSLRMWSGVNCYR